MISIIIPVYNAEEYIIDCLNSIKQQNMNVEAICVNDGSTDRSELILKKYSSEHSFVKYIYQENAGAPAARNAGLDMATGKYCMFFDADDILLPNALNSMYSIMEKTNSDLVIGAYNEIDETGHIISKIEFPQIIANSSEKWHFALCPPLPGNKLIKKSILDDANLKFEVLKIGQDLNFYLKLLAVAKNIKFLNEPVMGYRIVNGSISRQYTLKILDICNSIDDVKEYYDRNELSNEYNSYISIVALIAYRSQLEKIKYFSNKTEIAQICNVLDARIKKCKIPKKNLKKIYAKERIKCFLILLKYYPKQILQNILSYNNQ